MSESYTIFCNTPPQDAISQVRLTIDNDRPQVFVSSWDSTLQSYDAQTGTMNNRINVGASPLLSLAICKNQIYLCGNLANQLYVGDIDHFNTPPSILGVHKAPIRCIEVKDQDTFYTGSWDQTVKAWDLRQPQPTETINLGAKVFAMAVSNMQPSCRLVVCDSLKRVSIYDSRNLSSAESVREGNCSVLKSQLRDVACFPDGLGYAVSSVEGRVAWEYFDPALGPDGSKQNYAFKCHREKEDQTTGEIIYPVNCLSFHQKCHSFATGGGDGVVILWDGYNKKRLWKSKEDFGGRISSLEFHPVKPIIAIGISDGKDKLPRPRCPGKVAIQFLQQEEITPKVKSND